MSVTIRELIDLDFRPGIRAEEINDNFQLIKDWIIKERLRTAGWGIVEGFDLSADEDNFVVTVGKGILINKKGEEVIVDQWSYGAGEVDYREITKTYSVNESGCIELEDYPYDPTAHRYVAHNPPENSYDLTDDIIEVRDADEYYIPVVRIVGKNLYINATEYAGKLVTVKQKVASDRVDTIMIHENGEYEYLWSIDSPSPSHVDLGDYASGEFCIGVVYWTITHAGVNCDFFINHRSYRRIYTNEDNVLYINGEPYTKPKWIYFEEPDEDIRQINDLWYDTDSNTLYIWRYQDGELGWVIVNDHSEIVVREVKRWTPDTCPKDLQTFKWEKEEINLRFVPGMNSLSVIIDQTPLMGDQFTETVMTEEELAEMKEFVTQKETELETLQDNLADVNTDRKTLEKSIQSIRKELKDAKSLYGYVLEETYIYQDSDKDAIKLFNDINNRLGEANTQLGTLLDRITEYEEEIKDVLDELELLHKIAEGNYVATGTGFSLARPLVRPSYVEAIVTHVVRMKPARETFQRAAIFIKEGDIVYSGNTASDPNVTDSTTNPGTLFETSAAYSVGDDQLEVFVDGVRLYKQNGINAQFFEVVDYEYSDSGTATLMLNYDYNSTSHQSSYRSHSSQHFRVNIPLTAGQHVSYRISKHVWSYDQLDALLKRIEEYAMAAWEKAQAAYTLAKTVQENVETWIADIQVDISDIKSRLVQLETSVYKHGDEIAFEDLPVSVRNNLVGTPINVYGIPTKSRTEGGAIRVTNVRIEKDSRGNVIGGDVFQVFYISPTVNRILIRPTEYDVEQSGDDILISLDAALQSSEATLYVVGFRRGLNR